MEGFPSTSALTIRYFDPLTQSSSYTYLGICGICGCVIDSLRMSVSWPDFRDNWGSIPLDSARSQVAKGYTTECTRRALIFKDLQKEQQQQGSQK